MLVDGKSSSPKRWYIKMTALSAASARSESSMNKRPTTTAHVFTMMIPRLPSGS